MRRHTVFLLQGGDVQRATVESMTEWSGAGLLHRVSFLDLDHLDQVVRVQDLEHFVLAEGALSEPIRLLEWMVQHNCDLVRLVTLHTADDSGGEADGVRKAEQVRTEMLQWLGERQRLVTIACFLTDPDRAHFDAASAMPTWAANLVISPTDQALPSGATAPVTAQDRTGQPNPIFADVASQNLCTLGGAWRFMEQGPLDSTRADSQAAGVQVVRSFVRCVDLEDPTPLVTNNALDRKASPGSAGWPVPTGSTPMVPAIPAGSFSEDAAAQLGDRHAVVVDVVVLPPATPRPRIQVGLWQSVKLYFTFLFRGFVQAPRLMLDSAVFAASTAASTMATNMIFGHSSEYEVKVGRPRLRPSSNTEALQQAVEAAARLADPTTSFMPPATRDLWQEYLRIGVALIDGSSMPPTQIRPQIGDTRAVIQDPADVAVRPDYPAVEVSAKALGQATDVVLNANDPLSVILTQDALRARLAALSGGSDSDTDDARDRTPQSDLPPVTALDDSPLDSGQQPAGDAAPEDAPTYPARPSKSSPTNESAAGGTTDPKRHREIRQIQEALDSVDKWVSGTREPYTWRLGYRLAKGLAEAQTQFLLAANQLENLRRPESDAGEVGARRIWTAIGLGIAFALGFITLGQFDYLGWDSATGWAVASLVIGAFISFRLFLSDLKRRFRLMYAYEAGIDAQNEATRAFNHYARETLRLNSVYWQYLQWTPVLATVLHDPFAGEPEAAGATEPIFIDNAPRSARSATARPDPVRLEALTNEARRRIFTAGWAQRSWEAGTGALLRDFGMRMAMGDGVDPFDDNLRQRTGALEYLKSGFLHGAHGVACRQEPEQAAAQLITSSPLGSLTTEVFVDGTTPYPDAAAPSDADPAEGLFHEIFPTEQAGSFPSYLWSAGGLQAPVDVRRTIIATLPAARPAAPQRTDFVDTVPVSHDGQLLFAAARVDLSEPCQATELVVFDAAQRGTASVAPPAVDDEGD